MKKENRPDQPKKQERKELVDKKFNAVVEDLLRPLQEIELSEVSVDEINTKLGELGKKALERSTQLLIESCKASNIGTISLQTWIGPQGVGKGATADTMKWTRDLMRGDNSDEILALFSTKYEIPEEKIQEIQVMIANPPELDEVVVTIFDIVAGDHADRIHTGTGGIFYPSGSERPEARYLPYKKQEKVTGKVVGSGAMVDPDWTNALVTLEIARSVAYGKDSIDLDVFPRTLDQLDYLQKLKDLLDEEGIELDHNLIHIEPIDEETAQLINENPEVALEVYGKVGEVFTGISENPDEYGFSEKELDLMEALDIKEDELGQKREKLMREGSELMRQKAIQMKERVISATKDSKNITAERIGLGLAASVGTTFFRVANRLSTQGRDDDAHIRKLARRLGIYYSETAPVAIKSGSKPIWAGGKDPQDPPAKNYEDAIEGTVKALAQKIDNQYEPNEDFIKLITEVYLIRTSK